jgi:hypothetical protein
MDWGSRAAEYARLLEVRDSLRRERAGSTTLSPAGQQLHDFVSAAAAELRGSDDEVRFMVAALAETDSSSHWFAVDTLTRRKQFPLVYVEPLVNAGIKQGRRGVVHMLAASHAAGPGIVWKLLAQAVDSDSLAPECAGFLSYYVRARKWATDPTPEAERKTARDSLMSAIVASKNRANRRVFR